MFLEDINEACGVVGVWTAGREASFVVERALVAVQHRGEEAAGITVSDGRQLRTHRGLGEVRHVFAEPVALPGGAGIGHVRYPTAGSALLSDAQPLPFTDTSGVPFAVAHNGNLAMHGPLADVLADAGGPEGSADTRALGLALADRPGPLRDTLAALLPAIRGSYCLVAIDRNRLFAVRDPHGFRPLCLGRLREPAGWVVASESAALDAAGADFVRDVEPGELLTIDAAGVHSIRFAPASPSTCAFEYVYFARADSRIDGVPVHSARTACGRALAFEHPVDADVVVPVPDTARPAAVGFAEASGIRYGEALVRNNYLGRTFLKPRQKERESGVRLKLNVIPDVLRGRRVVVVDDSIVRATSIREVVTMVRRAGAREVHLRIASPPVRWPCFFGVDIRTRGELIAATLTPAQIAERVGADSLGYLSVAALTRATGGGGRCVGCFTGDYPDLEEVRPDVLAAVRGRS